MQNSFISSLKSKHFVIAGAALDSERPTSIFHLFKYEEDTPKKSSSISRTVDGAVFDLISNEDSNRQINLAVTRDDRYRIQLVFPERIAGE
jgi:hypothetical protein